MRLLRITNVSTHLTIQLVIRYVRCGQEQEGRGWVQVMQQRHEGCPEGVGHSVPPLVDVRDVDDAGKTSPGLMEHLVKKRHCSVTGRTVMKQYSHMEYGVAVCEGGMKRKYIHEECKSRVSKRDTVREG